MTGAHRVALYRQTEENLPAGRVGGPRETAEAYLYPMRQTHGTPPGHGSWMAAA
jgi:hypothetical protein